MKRFFAAVFFRQAPAKGAFFALTLWIAGLYLLGSLLFFCWVNGWMGFLSFYPFRYRNDGLTGLHVFLSVSLLLPIYFLGMAARLRWSRKLRSPELLMFALLPAWALLLPVVNLSFGPFLSWWNGETTVLFLLLLLISLFFCRGEKWWGAGILVAWGGGLLMCIVALNGIFTWENVKPEQRSIDELTRCLGESGWTLWIGVALLLLLAGYLFTAKFLAVQTGEKFRALFGKPVLICWAGMVGVYLIFTAMALVTNGKTQQLIRIQEEKFGHPLTTKGQESLYYAADARFDTAFWNRIEAAYGDDKITESQMGPSRSVFTGEQLAGIRAEFDRNNAALTAWEKDFSGPLPLMEHKFQQGELFSILLPNLGLIRKFNRFELWRIRFALADGDLETALAAYARIGQTTKVLGQEVFLVSGMVWLQCVAMQLDAMELLLESGRLSDVQLRQLAETLNRTDTEIPKIQKISNYGEAVWLLDLAEMYNTGRGRELIAFSPYNDIRPPSWNSVALFVPQIRWWRGLDEWDMLHKFVMLSNGNKNDFYLDKPFLLAHFLPALDLVSKRFSAISVRLQAMRALIDAELYRRKHGDFPETLENLPRDPFGNGPLRYRKGECMFPKAKELLSSHIVPKDLELVPVPAVQVWSVGTDGQDDGGTGDDIRAVMRIKASE